MTINSYKNIIKRDQRTKRTIFKKMGNPEDIVGVATFLAAECI